jgi:hypothetical protein
MNVPPDSPFVEELFLADLVRFGMMADEDDLDAPVLGADELVEQEEEAPRQVLLHRVHRPGGVHDADDDRVGLAAHLGRDVAIDEVVDVEGEAARGRRSRGIGLPSASSSTGTSSAAVAAASRAASRATSIGFVSWAASAARRRRSAENLRLMRERTVRYLSSLIRMPT